MFRYESHVPKPCSLVQPHLPLVPPSNLFYFIFLVRERENTRKKESHKNALQENVNAGKRGQGTEPWGVEQS